VITIFILLQSAKQNLEMISFSTHWLANWVIGKCGILGNLLCCAQTCQSCQRIFQRLAKIFLGYLICVFPNSLVSFVVFCRSSTVFNALKTPISKLPNSLWHEHFSHSLAPFHRHLKTILFVHFFNQSINGLLFAAYIQ